MIGLGLNATKNPTVKKTIVRDGLVLRHDYKDRPVEPVSSGAASFDGTSDYIQLANAISDDVFSISAWVNVTDDATTKALLDARDENNDGIAFLINANERAVLQINNSDSAQSSAAQLTAGVWQHIVGTYDGTNIKLYIDGVLVETTADGGSSETVSATGAARIGKTAYTSAQWFNGYMANVGVWSAALTQPQIKSIMHKDYAALSASEKDDLVSWWNLDEETNVDGTAGTGGVKDHKGSNHGTLE